MPGTPIVPGVPGVPDADLLADCVHCGFCLPACPTYGLWAQEMDSPRGRLELMGLLSEGASPDPAVVSHLDACLGCLACVGACPSGVRYDVLIEQARAFVAEAYERPLTQEWLRRLIFALFPHPRRLRVARTALRLYEGGGGRALLTRSGLRRRLPPALAAMEGLASALPPARGVRLPARVAARGGRRAVVGLLQGCVQSVFFGAVNAAAVRVLAAEGCEVVIPPAAGCCGALSLHAGREQEARTFARGVVVAFEAAGVDAVVVTAAGCGSAMKSYDRLLGPDAGGFAGSVRDVTEFLADLPPRTPRTPLRTHAAYVDACHLRHGQGVIEQPRALLRTVPGLALREVAEPSMCCGSAGTYNLLQPEAAAALGERKALRVLATGADVVVTANPGCALQIGGALRALGHRLPILHPVQVLDASLSGQDPAREATIGRRGVLPARR